MKAPRYLALLPDRGGGASKVFSLLSACLFPCEALVAMT